MSFHNRMRQLLASVCWLIAIVAVAVAALKTAQLVVHGRLDSGTSTGLSIVVTVAYWLFALAVAWIARTLTDLLIAHHPQLATANPLTRLSPLSGTQPIGDGHDIPPDPDHVAAVVGLGADASNASAPVPQPPNKLLDTGAGGDESGDIYEFGDIYADRRAREARFISPQRAQRIVNQAAAERARYERDPAAWQRRRHRRTTGIVVMIWACTVLMTIVTISSHSDWQRSNYVQQHGIATVANVMTVKNHTNYCGRFSFECGHSASITVLYTTAVLGQRYGTINYPSEFRLPPGTPLNVLLDPKQPTYVEVAGVPYVSKRDLIENAVLAGIMIVICAYSLLAFLHARRSTKQQVAPPSNH